MSLLDLQQLERRHRSYSSSALAQGASVHLVAAHCPGGITAAPAPVIRSLKELEKPHLKSTETVKNGHIPFALYLGSGILELRSIILAFLSPRNV